MLLEKKSARHTKGTWKGRNKSNIKLIGNSSNVKLTIIILPKWRMIIAVLKFSNLSNWKEEAWKKSRLQTGFKPVTSAIPVRCSTNWAMKPHIRSEAKFIEFISPVRSEMMWSIYEITQDIYLNCGCRLMKVKNDHCSKCSNLSNWKEEAWKNQGFNGIRTCDVRDNDAMLYQLKLWSHTLGSEANLYWVHISPWGVKWCELYMK